MKDLQPFLPIIVPLVTIAWAVFSWIYQTQTTGLRGKIKADLEIFEKTRDLFGQEHETTKQVEKYAIALLSLQYASDPTKPVASISWPDLALGLVLAINAIVWPSLGYREVWQWAVAGTCGFVSIGAFINAFATKKARQQKAA